MGKGSPEAHAVLRERCTPWLSTLCKMVAVRMDRRLASRVGASDVVQEALAEAARRLLEYLRQRPAPFYVWLRELARQRLIDLSRRHLYTRRRGVGREAPWTIPLADESAMELADQLISSGTSPSGRMQKDELRGQVRAALARLEPSDGEVLVLRYLEQLSTHEVAAVLKIAEPTVRYRQRRALERLGELLDDPRSKEQEQ